jgi:ribose 5-phosphate isomerase B
MAAMRGRAAGWRNFNFIAPRRMVEGVAMDTAQTFPVAIGCDHAGFPLKAALVAALRTSGHEVLDMGTNSAERVDYPDHAHAVCEAVTSGRAQRGVLICGSGIGMSIAANRHSGIRCALVGEPVSARLCRAHNDANVLALGARLTGEDMAVECLRAFLSGTYEGGRHDQRLAKLTPA